jgi:hypothetical protein
MHHIEDLALFLDLLKTLHWITIARWVVSSRVMKSWGGFCHKPGVEGNSLEIPKR